MVFIGSITTVVAALIASMQDDLKRVIAYSTCSQLGYMLIMCGMSQYNLAFYHLISHAFFKALLFLCGGVIIHIYNNQDMRKMSGLRNISQFVYVILLICVFSLDGFFFFSCFKTKDFILEMSGFTMVFENGYTWLFAILTLFLTICYNSALLDICSGQNELKKAQTLDLRYIVTLSFLAFLVLLTNLIFFQVFVNDFSADTYFINIANEKFYYSEFLSPYYKLMVVIFFSLLASTNRHG